MTLVLSGNTGSALDGIKNSLMFLETAKATTSGTSIDFTGIPSWAKKITVMFSGVSTNGASYPQIQIGSGSAETSGYFGLMWNNTSGTIALSSTGFSIASATATATIYGHSSLNLVGSNLWEITINLMSVGSGAMFFTAGSKTTSGTLDRLRITTVNGTDTFDNGSVNILIEGYV
jgi:hypothetical protein